jgi:hypothetical protein
LGIIFGVSESLRRLWKGGNKLYLIMKFSFSALRAIVLLTFLPSCDNASRKKIP